ncbi:hypothetical protein [Saccharopolyspora sp. NPDC050642]|uniref:hypothetical protein n=1 Tax=Saccharopolyspora sp. NPDC050642 TaxID=3157099 RepID=UPI0033CEB6F9
MSTPTSDTLTVSAADLMAKVGDELKISRDAVETALATVNIGVRTPAVSDRRLQLARLVVVGEKKSGESFTVDRRFGSGVWAIVHPENSAGKTSLLELLVLPLRGASRDLPKDVRSWVRHLRLDAVVAGRPVRISIDASGGWERRARATIRTADSEDELINAPDEGLRSLAEAVGLGEIEQVIGQFMLDTLRMNRTQLWSSSGGADGDGAPSIHGWTSYFGACYLNHGGDQLLLGDVNAPGLPGKLMELFVDLPYSSTLAEVTVAEKREARTAKQHKRRAEGDAAARASERAVWWEELDQVESEITELRSSDTPRVSGLLHDLDRAADTLREARETFERTDTAFHEARDTRLRAEQAKLDATETWQARRVLGRLDPTCCPRCEEPLTPERRSQERSNANCAVCTRTLPQVEPELAEAILAELDQVISIATAAEAEISSRHQEQRTEVKLRRDEHEAARRALDDVMAGEHPVARLQTLEIKAAELRGRLSATAPSEDSPPSNGTSITSVLAATRKQLLKVVDKAAKTLLPEMDAEIVALCKRFGVQNLDSVKLDRAAHVNAVKDGEPHAYKDLSRGDRLRMRIATVIALLRIGKARGVTSHPGLLIIDSIAAEELNEAAARSLITELQKITQELPTLQVVFTTAHPEFVDGLLPEDHIITAERTHLF